MGDFGSDRSDNSGLDSFTMFRTRNCHGKIQISRDLFKISPMGRVITGVN